MNILFAAGDVGGARAILPIARLAHEQGHKVTGLRHGVFLNEGQVEWNWVDVNYINENNVNNYNVVFYATSVADWRAFDVAFLAHESGIPIIHVLDNWSSYYNRLFGPESIQLLPDIYSVMDELAYTDAVEEGVDEVLLTITGHPNLGDLAQEASQFKTSEPTNKVLFISEPAKLDSGDENADGFRGYTEEMVSGLFVESLMSLPNEIFKKLEILIAPHPREDRDEVILRCHQLIGKISKQRNCPLSWHIVAKDGIREALHSAQFVVGMSSILLYEAWLLGKPVASLQPNVKINSLKALSKRKGLIFCDDIETLQLKLVDLILSGNDKGFSEEMKRHIKSASHLLKLAETLILNQKSNKG